MRLWPIVFGPNLSQVSYLSDHMSVSNGQQRGALALSRSASHPVKEVLVGGLFVGQGKYHAYACMYAYLLPR